MEKKTFYLTGLAILSLMLVTVFTSCEKDDDDNNMYSISATMNGASEVPAVTTTGTGTVSGTYDANTNLLTYSANWNSLSGAATMAHFHGPASTTATAPPIVTWTLSGNTATGTATLTDAQETDLLNGMWYANVHTAANSGGEIRGQVVATQ